MAALQIHTTYESKNSRQTSIQNFGLYSKNTNPILLKQCRDDDLFDVLHALPFLMYLASYFKITIPLNIGESFESILELKQVMKEVVIGKKFELARMKVEKKKYMLQRRNNGCNGHLQ